MLPADDCPVRCMEPPALLSRIMGVSAEVHVHTIEREASSLRPTDSNLAVPDSPVVYVLSIAPGLDHVEAVARVG